LVRLCAKIGDKFQVHCWSDELAEMELLSSFASKIDFDWKHGTVFQGRISPEFLSFLCDLPKPQDREIYNKMTPFFTIQFGDTMESSHYGTELYIMQAPENAREDIESILHELEEDSIVHRDI